MSREKFLFEFPEIQIIFKALMSVCRLFLDNIKCKPH